MMLGERWLRLLRRLGPSDASRGADSSGAGEEEEDSQPVISRVYVRVEKKREKERKSEREEKKQR
jgi:hypothetical protein